MKQLGCNRKVRDFAMALRARKVSRAFQKRALCRLQNSRIFCERERRDHIRTKGLERVKKRRGGMVRDAKNSQLFLTGLRSYFPHKKRKRFTPSLP